MPPSLPVDIWGSYVTHPVRGFTGKTSVCLFLTSCPRKIGILGCVCRQTRRGVAQFAADSAVEKVYCQQVRFARNLSVQATQRYRLARMLGLGAEFKFVD